MGHHHHHKNYYSILNIPKNASEEDIKKAYRHLALKHHPDKNGDKKNPDDAFRNICEAYEVLIDSKKRIDFDKTCGPEIKKSAKQRHGTDIRLSLKITVNDLANEAPKNIQTTRLVHCPNCNGTGSKTKSLTQCNKCSGTGLDMISIVMGAKKYCAVCKGFGNYVETSNCGTCLGTGLISENITRSIKIPREYTPTLLIPGSGNFSVGSNIPGNLIIVLEIEKSSPYTIDGKNIRGHLKISPPQAVLGDIIFLDIYGNPIKVIIPPGIKHHEIIEVEKAGIIKNNKKGNLILKVFIETQIKLSEEERKLYTQLLKLEKGFI